MVFLSTSALLVAEKRTEKETVVIELTFAGNVLSFYRSLNREAPESTILIYSETTDFHMSDMAGGMSQSYSSSLGSEFAKDYAGVMNQISVSSVDQNHILI